ncbi:MAG TPA: hypothetical protein VNB22_16860 [Pyrinomonadaceae bacterium]|jgi:EamA domain-containing membrane protein RarD|nr:hypothetical protein [Pyrinomonadaceae bacterium]
MKRIEKPIGLYVLTFADFIGFGVLQFFKTIQDAQSSKEETSFVIIFITLFLCVFTAASAVWAFVGDNTGRYALLTFITLNILWIYGNLLIFILDEGIASKSGADYLIAAGKGIWGFGANFWYLMNDEVVAYFNQQSNIK